MKEHSKIFYVAWIVIFALLATIGLFKFTERIPAGQVGVQYSYKNGVKDELLTQGLRIVSPFVEVDKFTIAEEQLILSKDKREGSKDNESFTVATKDNASIRIDFQMSYNYIPEKIVSTYEKFRGMDGEDIIQQRVKTVLKSKISEVTNQYTMMEVYNSKRAEINDKVTEYLDEAFSEDYGIHVKNASIIESYPDKELKKAIDRRITVVQQKQEAEAKQEAIKVQKDTELMQAEADAKIAVTKAEAEAEKVKINAQAEADANKKISDSLTDKLIRMKEAEARLKHGWITITGADTIVTK